MAELRHDGAGSELDELDVGAKTGPAVVATGTFLSDSPFPSTSVVEGHDEMKADEAGRCCQRPAKFI